MDLATILGIVSGLGLLFWALIMGGSVTIFFHLPSLLITMGGTFAATLINYPLGQAIGVLRVLKNAFMGKGRKPEDLIADMVNLAQKARREGLLALEDDAEEMRDPFLKRGIELLVDGTDSELVRGILETELSFVEDRHKRGQSLFETMGALAPAFGMIGTLIGLIQMLRNLQDPDSVGPGMATALITTFYGALAANLIFIPIAGKLKVKTSEEVFQKELTIEGILSIQAGDNPRIVEQKLKAFLSPTQRDRVVREKPRAEGVEGAEANV
ncbi:MAG: MotA/TolQ/ExbB proton channel family protein [Bacillota bacterium]